MNAARIALLSLAVVTASTSGLAQGSDSCATAQVVVGTGIFAFDTTAATTDGIGDPLCQNAAHDQIYLDVWYAWTAPTSGSYTFATCGQTTLDSRIAVYDGSCAGAILACNDDGCDSLRSTVDVVVTSGNVYVVRLGGYGQTIGGTGTFTISVTGQLVVLDTQVNPNNGRTYHLLAAGTWTAAEGTAIALGGHLATVDNAVENAWLVSTWQNYLGTPRDLWIGFNDAAVEGTFAWADGTSTPYTNWDPGEPNNALTGEDYTNIRRDRPNGEWNDLGNNPTGFFNAVHGVVEIAGSPSTPFCSGDGSGTACPCGNSGLAGNGCANSAFAAGAHLDSSGSAGASAGTDTLVLTASNMPGPGLFFQGDGQFGAGAGIQFGDGLLCAGGTIIRMGVVFPTANTASYPGGLTPNPIHIAGATSPGDVRHYQCWYRDAVSFCTAATYNLTQGLTLTWGP